MEGWVNDYATKPTGLFLFPFMLQSNATEIHTPRLVSTVGTFHFMKMDLAV